MSQKVLCKIRSIILFYWACTLNIYRAKTKTFAQIIDIPQ